MPWRSFFGSSHDCWSARSDTMITSTPHTFVRGPGRWHEVRGLVSFVLLLVCSYAISAIAQGAPLPSSASGEIKHLLSYVESSGCEFLRNGRWHDGRSARDHLTMKFDYLQNKGLVSSADDFIVKVATASTTTGSTYKVRCGGRPAIASADWLRAELVRLRRAQVTPSA